MSGSKEELMISRKTYLVGVWTIVITVLLALAGGAIGVTYSMGAFTNRVETLEVQGEEHEIRLKNLENNTQRTLDRIEFNLKNYIERSGVPYTELPK